MLLFISLNTKHKLVLTFELNIIRFTIIYFINLVAMKKWLLFYLLIIFQLSIFQSFHAQSADKGKINLYLGGGAGLMKREGNGNINITKDFLSTRAYLGLDVNVNKQISIGLEVISQYFITSDTSKVRDVDGGSLGLNLKYHFLNKEKSSAYVGSSLGVFSFGYKVIDPDFNEGKLIGNGIYNSLFLGYNKYFGNVFGLFIQTGFINQPMQMDSLVINGNSYDSWNRLQISDWKIKMRGLFVNAGFTLKFRNK